MIDKNGEKINIGDTVKVIDHDGTLKQQKMVGETGVISGFVNSLAELTFSNGDKVKFWDARLELVENPKQIEAEILDEIEAETFKRLAKKFLKLRKEKTMSGYSTKVILQCDGEILDTMYILEGK